MTITEVFVLLQILDFGTTLIGLRMGGTEMSPFARWLMDSHTLGGLAVVKLIGFGLGAVCIWRGKLRVLDWVNYIFSGIVLWNLYNIAGAVGVSVFAAQ